MMPKGVEHRSRERLPQPPPPVKIPMMPKGVEHSEEQVFSGMATIVKIPMMPKGVEHLSRMSACGPVMGEDSNDAERR